MMMNRIALSAFLAVALCVAPSPVASQERSWWDDGWKYRRVMTLKNPTGAPYGAGRLVTVTVDLDYLGVSKKMKEDLADLRVVVDGKEITVNLSRVFDRTFRMSFRLGNGIAAGGSDEYSLYYGNPKAAPPTLSVKDVGFTDRFSTGKVDPAAIEIAPAFAHEVKEGRLVLTAKEGTLTGENGVRVKTLPAFDAFQAGFFFRYEPAEQSEHEVALVAGFGPRGDLAEELTKRIEGLIADLGNDEWATREKAGKELEKIGAAAVPQLRAALSSNDAEIRLRAGRILENILKAGVSLEAKVGVLRQRGGAGGCVVRCSVGRKNMEMRQDASPSSLRFQISRDKENMVSVFWNGQQLLTETMAQPISSLCLVVRNASPGPLGKIEIEEIHIVPMPDLKPAYVIEREEERP